MFGDSTEILNDYGNIFVLAGQQCMHVLNVLGLHLMHESYTSTIVVWNLSD